MNRQDTFFSWQIVFLYYYFSILRLHVWEELFAVWSERSEIEHVKRFRKEIFFSVWIVAVKVATCNHSLSSISTLHLNHHRGVYVLYIYIYKFVGSIQIGFGRFFHDARFGRIYKDPERAFLPRWGRDGWIRRSTSGGIGIFTSKNFSAFLIRQLLERLAFLSPIDYISVRLHVAGILERAVIGFALGEQRNPSDIIMDRK